MMKKILIVFTVFLIISCGESNEKLTANTGDQSSLVATTTPTSSASSQDANGSFKTPKNLTTIKYTETKHDFGDVLYPSENMHTFKFQNTGKQPLIIESATASCGCTIPNKPEEPIAPGEYGELDVIFRPKEGQMGQLVTKKITVIANTEPEQTYLEIKGNVLRAILSE